MKSLLYFCFLLVRRGHLSNLSVAHNSAGAVSCSPGDNWKKDRVPEDDCLFCNFLQRDLLKRGLLLLLLLLFRVGLCSFWLGSFMIPLLRLQSSLIRCSLRREECI